MARTDERGWVSNWPDDHHWTRRSSRHARLLPHASDVQFALAKATNSTCGLLSDGSVCIRSRTTASPWTETGITSSAHLLTLVPEHTWPVDVVSVAVERAKPNLPRLKPAPSRQYDSSKLLQLLVTHANSFKCVSVRCQGQTQAADPGPAPNHRTAGRLGPQTHDAFRPDPKLNKRVDRFGVSHTDVMSSSPEPHLRHAGRCIVVATRCKVSPSNLRPKIDMLELWTLFTADG